jgi:hypothetical protein
MEDVKLQITPAGPELVIRTGEAPKIEPPTPINISGQITAPRLFFEARKGQTRPVAGESLAIANLRTPPPEFPILDCHVIVDWNNRTIKFVQEDRSYWKNTITGTLNFSKVFREFDVNGTTPRRPQELAKLLKRYLFLFSDRENAMKLISDLMNFKGSIKADVEDSKDNRGNRKNSVAVAVETNIPVSFVLQLPVFDGRPKVAFPVEIVIEAQNNQAVDCYLQSTDVYEFIEEETSAILEEEIKPFQDAGFAVIEV